MCAVRLAIILPGFLKNWAKYIVFILELGSDNFFICLTVLSCTCLGLFYNYTVSIIILHFNAVQFKFLTNYLLEFNRRNHTQLNIMLWY